MSPNPQETADLVTFTEEILNGKLHFLCSDKTSNHVKDLRKVSKTPKLHLTKLHAEAVRLEGKPKSSLASPYQNQVENKINKSKLAC